LQGLQRFGFADSFFYYTYLSHFQILARFAKIWKPPPTTLILSKKTTMIPTREQFKESVALIKYKPEQ
jgi:hypothetical protein